MRLLSRNDLRAERPLSRAGRGARPASAATRFVVDGEVVAFDGGADQLRGLAAARAAGRERSSSTCSTCSGSTATTCARCRCASASGCCATRSSFEGPLRLTPHRNARRRGVLRGGLPQGLGGPDRQAGRQPVHARALARLAEVQVRAGPGAGDRRLHRPEGLARGVRRAAARLLRRRRAALRRARWAPGFDAGDARRPGGEAARRCAATTRRSPTRARSRSAA